jgi:hypothetical protein
MISLTCIKSISDEVEAKGFETCSADACDGANQSWAALLARGAEPDALQF